MRRVSTLVLLACVVAYINAFARREIIAKGPDEPENARPPEHEEAGDAEVVGESERPSADKLVNEYPAVDDDDEGGVQDEEDDEDQNVGLDGPPADAEMPPLPPGKVAAPNEETVPELVAAPKKLTPPEELVPAEGEVPHEPKKRMVMRNKLWTGAKIPYIMTAAVKGGAELNIKQVMKAYERFTCFRFYPWSTTNGKTTNQELGLSHTGYLKFIDEDGCWAKQGNENWVDGQPISCCGSFTCIHELGHSMGAYHEQQNPGSTGYIRVNENNILEPYRYTFKKAPASELSAGYDIYSVMHYDKNMWSNGNGDSITSLFSDLKAGMNDYYYLMMEVSLSHDCAGLYCKDFTIDCVNDGYLTLVDGKCACRCPPHLDPDTGCSTLLNSKSSVFNGEFPAGSYGLPQPASGCPRSGFATGSRTHYSQRDPCKNLQPYCDYWKSQGICEKNPDYMWWNCKVSCDQCWKYWSHTSESYHLAGTVADDTVENTFCVKDEGLDGSDDEAWPTGPGEYCIYKKGGKCPAGFTEGSATFTGVQGDKNTVSGALPDGAYNTKTRLEFCCHTEIDLNTDNLKFPIDKPFALLQWKKSYPDCPKVQGMHHTREEVTFNNVGRATISGSTPVKEIASSVNLYTLPHCYYTPVDMDCGGIIDLTPDNPTFEFSSPQQNAHRLCTWLLRGPEGTRVAVKFDESKFDKDGEKCVDTIYVNKYRLASTPWKYCKSQFDETEQSFLNTMVITYESFDQVKFKSSFKASASLIYDGDMCYKLSDHGVSYAGSVNFTRTFKPCIPWSNTTACSYNAFKPSPSLAYMEHNFCRNPGDGLRPWCYTDSTTCAREYCDVCLLENIHDTHPHCEIMVELGMCGNDPRAFEFCGASCNAKYPVENDNLPIASEVTCGPPGDVVDGNLISATKDSYVVGDTATYVCKINAEVKQDRRCLTTGEWSSMNYVCNGCKAGGILANHQCYIEMDGKANFAVARQNCKKMGATLATARNVHESELLLDLRGRMGEIWISGTDGQKEGTWLWNEKDAFTWTNWVPGQPNNWYNEDCLAQRTDGKWLDQYCAYEKGYFCTHAPLDSGVCDDFADNCHHIYHQNPTACTTMAAFMASNCRKTCGQCIGTRKRREDLAHDEESATECEVELPSENAMLIDGAITIKLGDFVTYECIPGYLPNAGDPVRGCQPNGKMTGSTLQCVPLEQTDVMIGPTNWVNHKTEQIWASYAFSGSIPYFLISRDGVIKVWEYYGRGKGVGAFQVWRDNGNYNYKLVGQNKFKTIKNFELHYYVKPEDQIAVKKGDYIGIYIDKNYPAGIHFARCDINKKPEYKKFTRIKSPVNTVEDFKVGSTYKWQTMHISNLCQIQNFRAVIGNP